MICEEEVRQEKIVNVLPQWRGRSAALFFVYPAQRFVSPKVRAFIRLAEGTFRQKKFFAAESVVAQRSGNQTDGDTNPNKKAVSGPHGVALATKRANT